MNRKQLENLYKVNGLIDYRLRNTEDLLKVLGIDFADVKGYATLDDLNKVNYERFIVRFFNGWGFEPKMTILPKGIYWVEDIERLIDKEDYCVIVGGTIKSIDKNGVKTVIHDWNSKEDEYKNCKSYNDKPKYYLRFEYTMGEENNKEWLHVTEQGTEWY